MSVSSTRKLSSFTKLLHITGLLRGETVSREAPPLQDMTKLFSPELALTLERAARMAEEEDIDIEEPIEGDIGL